MTHHALPPTLIEPSLMKPKISSQNQFGIESKRWVQGGARIRDRVSVWLGLFIFDLILNQIKFDLNLMIEMNLINLEA